MISKEELLRIAGEKHISPTVIERDYAIGWVLWGISKDPVFSGRLVFKEKAEYKNVPFDDVESLIGDDKYSAIEPHWSKQLDHQLTYAPKPELIREEFNTLVKNLFEQEIPDLAAKVIQPEIYLTRPELLGNREKIIRAGKATNIIRMIYDGSVRLVEPYSFRYEGGREYFYGYNLSGGSSPPGIRGFLTAKIKSVEITGKTYNPCGVRQQLNL